MRGVAVSHAANGTGPSSFRECVVSRTGVRSPSSIKFSLSLYLDSGGTTHGNPGTSGQPMKRVCTVQPVAHRQIGGDGR